VPSTKDYYDILGVKRDASEAEIKRAYRKLAKEHHPDSSSKTDGASEQKFKEASEAYEVLSDPQKRANYDRFGTAGGAPGFDPSGFGQGGFDFGGFGEGGLGDIFESFFGGAAGGRSQSRASRGDDLQKEILLTFDEAVNGATKEIAFDRIASCESCKGSGAEPGSSVKECDECKGSGQVRRTQRTILGQIVTARPCSQCGGNGKIPDKRCKDCGGGGVKNSDERIKVEIPAGVDDGEVVRIGGRGNAGPMGMPPGDLFLRIRVRPSREFERLGLDIATTVKITIPQAVLGDEISVKTVQGDVLVKIPSGTVSGSILRLKGKGVRHRDGSSGNHMLTVEIDIPKKPSRKQKELYQQLKELD
jgi:molecular chaperone DnaJ